MKQLPKIPRDGLAEDPRGAISANSAEFRLRAAAIAGLRRGPSILALAFLFVGWLVLRCLVKETS